MICRGGSNEVMWTSVNAFQMIYLTLGMELYHTLYVHVMFSFLAFVNMENPIIANFFLVNIDVDLLDSDPKNNRFEKIDIFYSLLVCLPSFGSCFLNLLHVTNQNSYSSMEQKYSALGL